MFNDETRVRQFLDEVKFVNKYNKEYDISLGDNIKAGLTFGDVDKFLEAKRIVYNQSIVVLTQKYGIDTNDKIYSDLDKIWNEHSGEHGWMLSVLKKIGEDPANIGTLNCSKVPYKGVLLPIVLFLGIPANLVIESRNAVVTKWSEYKQAVYAKMEEYGDNAKNVK